MRDRLLGVQGGVDGQGEEQMAVVVVWDGAVVGVFFLLARDGGQKSDSQVFEEEGLELEKESFEEGMSGCRCRCARRDHC